MFPYWETDSFKELKKEHEKEHGPCTTITSRNANQSKPLSDDLNFVGELFNILSPLTKRTDSEKCSNQWFDGDYNVVEITDEGGKVVANRIDVVVTPFNKEDISVSVNTESRKLSVLCDNEKKEPVSNERCLISGISHQTRSWSWDIPKNAVVSSISSKMENGILKITIPLTTSSENKESVFSVDID